MIESTQAYTNIPLYILNTYYLVVLLGALYLLYKYGLKHWIFFLILIFWQGFFDHLKFINPRIFEFYKIFVFVYSVVLFSPKIKKIQCKADTYINGAFLLFSMVFWLSYFLNKSPLTTTLSQYGFKYATIFLLYHGLKDVISNNAKREYLMRVLFDILILQIVFSFAKFFLLGLRESIVGSIQYSGGGTAVFLPMLGLFILWVKRSGVIRRKDILLLILFFSIALISGKRAPVILFPSYLLIITSNFFGNIRLKNLLIYTTIIFLIFYIGVKAVPSLNKENSNWGSFNINYVLDYSVQYNFGTENISKVREEGNQGRGASLFLLFNSADINLKSTEQKLFGRGIKDVVLEEEGRFVGGSGYYLEHNGLLSAAVIELYKFGYLGAVFMFLFCVFVILTIKNKKFRWTVLSLFLYDFFLYGNILVFHSALGFLLIFLCTSSNALRLKET